MKELSRLSHEISRMKAVNVNVLEFRNRAKEIVLLFFKNIEPGLQELQIDCERLDSAMQRLLDLANGKNPTRYYRQVFREIERESNMIELERARRQGEQSINRNQNTPTRLETQILSTLEKCLPSSAFCYKQVLIDISDDRRTSLRGTASELREVLRDVLDYLAPDSKVMSADDFRLEPDRKTPTMRQKVHFILKSREQSKSAMKAPEDATSIVEEMRPSFVRSTYERASMSTHTSTTRTELLQLKLYVDSVLCELLAIQK
jgi:hypothetical protein